jgi:hypothetical protein
MKTKLLLILISTVTLFTPAVFADEDAKLEDKLLTQQGQLERLQKEVNILASKLKHYTLAGKVTSNKNWQIKSYGSVLYKSEDVFRNTQDTSPEQRATTDLERVVLEFGYTFDPKWQIELELEYEHGGTGSTLEYDGFEEFGEFETEIEAGGEVLVEKLAVKFNVNDNFTLKFGRIFVPVGLGTDLHKPNQYFTTERHWSESVLIPQVWHETGINLTAKWQDFTVQGLVTTGLNSEYFRTYRWVASGHQKRFEQINADDLAITLRADYGDIKNGSGFGISFYNSDTSGNRNNTNNISGDGNLTILGLHGVWRYQSWTLRGQFLMGELEDSEAIAQANKTTPGLKPGNFSQLGSEAESAFIELGYNIQTLLGLSKPLMLFTSYDHANPIKKIENGSPTSRFDIEEFAIGMNYSPVKDIVIKAQFAEQIYAQGNLDNSQSFSLSMGYYFSI